ncbi:MAG: DMT family transporter [Gulosibacter sp.]|uniref:DMT family transporter n=1 Tax=Gulosibacter sp. TaxID=2817531 RepID=UPI003F926132
MRWVFLVAAIILEVTASLSLRGALDAPWLYAVVAVGYTASFGALFLSLRRGMPLGVGYGIWGACGVALTAIMSWVIFNEPITLVMGIGIVIVMVGVLLVELGSQAASKKRAEA